MAKAPIFTIKGTKTGEETLPKEFGEKINLSLLAQAVYVYEERSHVGLRSTLTRSEVNRTTKKIYKQKGTGGARHGSRRANLYVGGGIIFGPRPVRRIITLSGKIKTKARGVAYALKAKESELVVVSGISKIDKTKTAGDFLKALAKSFKAKRFTFILTDNAKDAIKFLRNLTNVRAIFFKDANAFDIYNGGLVILDQEIFKAKNEEVKAKTEKVVKKTVKKIAK